MSRSVLALGANLGDRAAALQSAVDALGRACHVCAVSRIYETVPVGGPAQPDYYNAVVIIETTLSAEDLLALVHNIESAAHRRRVVRWGPRTLDVDIIMFDDVIRSDVALTLPHPRAHDRGFVLIPWAEIAPDDVLPGRGRISDLLSNIETSGVRLIDSEVLTFPGAS